MRAVAAALVLLAGALVFSAGLLAECLYDCFGHGGPRPAGAYGMIAGALTALFGFGLLAAGFRDRPCRGPNRREGRRLSAAAAELVALALTGLAVPAAVYLVARNGRSQD